MPIYLPLGYNVGKPVIKKDGICYQYNGPDATPPDTVAGDEIYTDCVSCEISASPIAPGPAPIISPSPSPSVLTLGLYMTTVDGLHLVNVSTGELTLIADTTEGGIHKNIRTIFYDPRTGIIYANPGGSPEFGTLSLDGVYTKIADYTYPGDAGNAPMGAFALNAAQDQMYSTDYIHLYEFDEATGVATFLANVPGDDPGSCLVTLSDDRTFFSRTDNSGPNPDYGGIWPLNLETAVFGSETTVDGYPLGWGMRSMAELDGVLYAIQIAPANMQNGIFGTLDVDTAVFTPIGSVPGNEGQGKYWGLTAAPLEPSLIPSPIVPSPSI